MSGALKSALTLAVLAVLVLVAALWGWAALTAPFPEDEPVAICEDETVTAGSEVRLTNTGMPMVSRCPGRLPRRP